MRLEARSLVQARVLCPPPVLQLDQSPQTPKSFKDIECEERNDYFTWTNTFRRLKISMEAGMNKRNFN